MKMTMINQTTRDASKNSKCAREVKLPSDREGQVEME